MGSRRQSAASWSSAVLAAWWDLADGELDVVHPSPVDLRRMAQLVTTYRDLLLVAVDASVLASAERLNDYDIAALDHRHFTVVRPAGNKNFTLHP